MIYQKRSILFEYHHFINLIIFTLEDQVKNQNRKDIKHLLYFNIALF